MCIYAKIRKIHSALAADGRPAFRVYRLCRQERTPTTPTTEAATAEPTAAPTTPVTLQAPVMQTQDWDAYTPAKYQDKEHLSVTLNLTADLTAQDTILYQNGSKYAELVA